MDISRQDQSAVAPQNGVGPGTGRCVNLTFHGVGDPDPAMAPGEREVWASVGQFEAILDAVADRADVRISFDDGNASDVEHALPALAARGLSATFFVVAGRLGAPGYLAEDDLHALTAAGMRVGSHGMHHRKWRDLTDGELREELQASRGRLEDVVGVPVTHAACPFGAYDRRVLRALRGYGYERVFTSDGGATRAGDWLQARNSVRRGNGPSTVAQLLVVPPLPAGLRRQAKLAVKRWR
jgi:peptidoglycan/xylan/chitin deacetylase (PgdA/CDA1 family)